MRHSRISTTVEIYAQVVPESQRATVTKMIGMMDRRLAGAAKNVPVN